MNQLRTIVCALCCALCLYGCQSKLFTVYKIDVQQGNALEAESVEKVKLGMSTEQVRFILGTPLINDSFHPDRWDYIYLFIPGYGETQRRQLTLLFDRDEVIDIIKRNIVADDESIIIIADDESIIKDDENAEKEQLELEKQADELEEVLETNKDSTN